MGVEEGLRGERSKTGKIELQGGNTGVGDVQRL
jgi:hypothetical protein